jgi:branched-chain amino acid transport system substrate-binding protein
MNRRQLASVFALFSLALFGTLLISNVCPQLKCIVLPIPTPTTPVSTPVTLTATATNTLAPFIEATPLPTFSIGLASDLNGSNSAIGLIQEIGARVAISIFNSESAENGFRVQLLTEDTQSRFEPTFLRSKVDNLIKRDALYIIGFSLSLQTNRISDTIKSACLPLIAASNTGPGIPDLGDCNLRVSAPISDYVKYGINYANQRGATNIAIAYAADDPYFVAAEVKAFQDAIGDYPQNMNVVTTTTFSLQSSEFYTQVNAICDSDNPAQCNSDINLVIVSGLAASGGLLIKALREHGYTGMIIGGNGLNTPGIFNYCGLACDGVYFAVAYSHLAPTRYNQQLNTVYRTLSESRQENPHPYYPLQFTAQTFTAVQVIVEALKKINANPTTPIAEMTLEMLRNEVKSTLLSGNFSIETPLGKSPITLDTNGEIKQQDNFCVAQIQEMSESKESNPVQLYTGKFVVMPFGDGCVP